MKSAVALPPAKRRPPSSRRPRALANHRPKLKALTARPPAAGAEAPDAAWARLLNDPRPRPKLIAYAERLLREEKAEPMDFGKL